MPARVSDLPQEAAHSQARGDVGKTLVVLSLARTDRPFLLTNDMPAEMDLGSRHRIAQTDERSVGTLKADDPGVSWQGDGWIEAGPSDVATDLLGAQPAWAAIARREVEDQSIDV
jgi:hypothetical protein